MYDLISTPQKKTNREPVGFLNAVRQHYPRLRPIERFIAVSLKSRSAQMAVAMLLLLFTAIFSRAFGQQVESVLPLSERFTINLAAGVPGYVGNAAGGSNAPQSQWWFENTKNSATYATPSFVESSDSAWQQVGLPYDANIPRTFINQDSGGGQGSLTGQDNWYRLHFKVDPKYASQKFSLNLEGTHTGVQVFINGTLLRGISAVTANAQATHVVGFVPVVVDLTPYLHTDGVTDNVIAIDVSRGDPWFEQPGFSGAFRFGQAMAGLFRNVYLYVTDPVHIPLNVYSNQKSWGTYVGTVSEVPAAEGTATAASAVVQVQTNVVNESATAQQVTLTTQIVDASGNVVATAPPITQSVPPMTPNTFPSTPAPMFNQLITVQNPTLWYPNNSIYGKPYMYKVYHIVSVNGVVVDSFQSPLGIRTITWDANFPYFNGHAMYLWGGSSRYDYPALGSSVPDEQWWRDMAQIAAQGGNIWRPGHSTSSEEMVEAADAYGIMIDQPSGDGEGYWSASSNPSADDLQLKQEVHRDMIIRDRSHPSILDWEEDNGGMNQPLANELAALETAWDNINPRVQADRTYSPSYSYMGECDGAGCEAGIKNQNPNNPAFGAEYWDNMGTGRGTQTGTGASTVYAYDYELAFAAPYLDDWRQGRVANAFGMAQWYFADTPGEDSLWAEFQNQPAMEHLVRSLGYSSVDQNRFPRLLYYIYQANWVPYSIQPVVHLAHHWNRAYEYTPGTPLQENAFSNCPAVRLLINGVAKDPVTGAALADQIPNPWNINSHGDLTQNTTTMPGQVHWMVNWAPGTVTAECLDINGNVVSGATHSVTTAGAENKIVLSVVPEVTKPDGTSFQWTSNGSDAAMIMAQVQDANGNVVPTAADNVTFTVTGPATYMGGTQQLVADPSWTNYYQDAFSAAHSTDVNGVPFAFFHAPGDPELNFEGGLQKIALRSTFAPGTVTVTATAPGLASGSVQLTSVAPPAPPQSQPPAIIVPPVSTSVTVGFPATFTVAASGSGTLSYQWAVAGSEVIGATGPALTIPATALAENNESVTVTVRNAFGEVTSTPVTLTVDTAAQVAITTQPASQVVVVGQSATLTVAATGSPQLNYQWFENGLQVASGPQASYTTPILTAAGTNSFYVIVSNPLGQLQSSTATLTINAPAPVSITAQPASQIVAVNQPVQFTAVVAGSAPYTYQWQFTPKGGAATILVSNTQTSNTITYTLPAMSAANVGAFTVTVNNAANVPVTSAAAQLTLAPPGVNLALNMPATSSSSQNACTDKTTTPPLSGAGCLGAENAVDGNLNTRWGSATAGAPPTPPVPGVDPSWLQVDLGSVQAFNTVIINWENASAAQYQIQYTSADPKTNPTWNVAFTNNAGVGGTETLNFPTVQARYVRMNGTVRNGNFGYSIFEFQVYNVPQCGGSNERYTVNSSNPALVLDNLLGLTWTRTIQTDTAPGAQFTGVNAAAYCKSINMRLPTESEALGISGNNNASCAFPGVWSTWTSTPDPNDANETAIVNFDGSTSFNVTNNFPGATLCAAGASSAQAPVIQTQPQPTTVNVGQSATFTVVATGTPAPSYQWLNNGTAINGATAPSYTTPPTVATDNGASFSVTVSNGSGAVTSSSAALTVTNNSTGGGGTGGGSTNPPPPAHTACGDTTACAGNGSGPAPVGPNLALNMTASSSKDENGSFTAKNAVDANFNTRWSSGFDDDEWFQVDLGSVQPIGQIVIRWQTAFGTSYLIQTSNDGQTWTTTFAQPNGQGGVENLTFPTVNARYVRMQGQTRSTQYGYSFWEFEVYGPVVPTIVTQPVNQTVVAGATAQFTVVAGGNGPFTYQWLRNGVTIPGATSATYTTQALAVADSGGLFSAVVSNAGGSASSSSALLTVNAPPPTPTTGIANLALGKPATSSDSENPGLGPLNAVDGDLTTRWSSGFTDNQWLEVDLGSPMIINKVVIYWEASYGTAYQIQVSNDEQTWTTVATQTAGTGGVETLTFPSVVNRYIRLLGITRATKYGYSLFEFQVYGADLPAILTQPVNQTVNSGGTATFSATVGGDGPFTYQWQRNGVAIPGATSTSYTTPVVMSADSGSTFTLAVTNSSGTSNSTKATLTVNSSGPNGPNLALNQPATSSRNETPDLGPANAVDGDTTTRWSSAFEDPSWLQVDLGSPKTIGQVVIQWQNAYGTAYQIQVSNDQQNWTTVYTQSAGTGGVENITFPPASGRYVRMFGTTRSSKFGYSIYEFQVYGVGSAPAITTEPANQTANVGGTATFTVVAGGAGPFTYQWLKGNTPITGATAASYTTPVLAATDNSNQYSVIVGNASGTVNSTPATLTVNNSGLGYTIYPGFVGVDLNNNTGGVWADNQIYVTVIGMDPTNNKNFSYLTPDGTIVDFTANDSASAGHLTKNGMNYGNYSFTLAQSKLLKIPALISARAFISLGEPLYVQINTDDTGKVAGFTGPDPQNPADPNINTHLDWYEFNSQNGIFINTTQVDEFGLPLTLDVWGSGGTFHQQVGITESIAQLDSEFATEVPAQFQPPVMSNLRILSPGKLSIGAGGANANYFDSTIANAWSSYTTTPLTITVSGRQFTGSASGPTLTFAEVNPSSNHAGETFVVMQPSTQDVFRCAGTMAKGVDGTTPQLQDENAVQLQLENQICSATTRGVLSTPANWTNVSAYYNVAPANFYAQFWHKHSIGGLAYGFSFDDNNNQSTTINTQKAEHMAFGIGW